jgi:hypothetical protein
LENVVDRDELKDGLPIQFKLDLHTEDLTQNKLDPVSNRADNFEGGCPFE